LVPDISRVDAAVRGMRRCNTPQCTLGAVGRPSGPLVVQGLRSGRAGGGSVPAGMPGLHATTEWEMHSQKVKTGG